MTLIAGSVAAAGCVESSEPTSTESADAIVGHTVVTDSDALLGLPLHTVQYQRTGQGDKVSISGEGWTQTAPDQWTTSADGTTSTIKLAPIKNNLAVLPSVVSCNLNFYIGISSPVSGFVGEAAIGQADCVGGSLAFTITTQACTNLFGCVTQSVSGVASPGLPFTSGIAVQGTAGAVCQGTVVWNPSAVSVTTVNLCG